MKSKGASAKSPAPKAAPAKTANPPQPVPPDAVRVWRGFRLGTLMPQDFLNTLGSIFIPATAILQRLYGLTAYLPTVLPQSKPAGVPDEIALVFYRTQQAYTDTTKIVGGRAYSALHKVAFAFPQSLTGFPVLLASELPLDTPVHLFPDQTDWQKGYSRVYVGARDPSVPVPQFLAAIQKFLLKLRGMRPAGMDGAVACVSSAYVVYWEHWQSEAASLKGRIADLAGLSQRVILQPHVPTPIDPSITDKYAGIPAVDSRSFNIVFPR
jgi:hypothetical protein